MRGVRRGGRRGNLNSLGDVQYEIAALPSVARNDEERSFFNPDERPGHPPSATRLALSVHNMHHREDIVAGKVPNNLLFTGSAMARFDLFEIPDLFA